MLIARRADTKARADFATWKMMAKLNGASALPAEAQTFLASYKALLREMTEFEATEATIDLVYKSYYTKMGGVGAAPDIPAHASAQVTGNVTAFKRPPAQRPRAVGGSEAKPRLPVALIFACLVVVYVGFRYFMH
ncbi:MAG: hypothetical protein E7813_06855 [Bradyrhizobium sp.]|uniref:hypothetical protein n=1 Tax=Bradyrhizobium sp. TaxID=376 RepID=UPI0011F62F30|nr:hypothetical protein [Bradyrhizobium sp.]THD70917.1 MAG: hypothetical protein E7813_06855 [Bradyrhizobium sp.]